MKKHINLILVLMALCVVGIIGLQLFWNYQNYKSTVDTFQRDSNEALNTAVDQEMAQRHQQLVNRFKGWLADTSFITITCDTNNREGNTVFHIKDRYPKYADSKGFSFGISDFKEKLPQITPRAKTILIKHFGQKMLWGDLKKGFVYYYTPRLGDSLDTAYKNSSVNRVALTKLYQKLLAEKGIRTSFVLNQDTIQANHYSTKPVNTSLRRPYKKDLVWAGFESPDTYFLKNMKWVIISTLLLITIALVCFGYTAKTLLSQHKLAELKDSFISNMTHELNTPLASIKITAEALKTFAYPPETQKAYLDIIGHQTDKLTALTTQILNTNRLVRSSEETWQGLDLNALMTKAIHDLAVRLDQQQAVVNYEPLSEVALVRGEAASLTNVFTNIIDNALKYAPHQAKLDIRLSAKHRQVEIAFADNGIGIPAEYQDKVFERFFRVPQGNVHDVKGYGLGLSYVRQVIQQHRGSVHVRANQPCGSVFIVQLPLL